MKYKMIVSDFDGTLYDPTLGVTEKTQEVIKRYVDKGGIFTIVTGRDLLAILPHAKKLGVSQHVISYNGGSLYDLTQEKEIEKISFSTSDAVEIIKKMSEEGLECQVYCNNNIYSEEKTVQSSNYEEKTNRKITYVGRKLYDYVEKEKIEPTKILAFVTDDSVIEKVNDYNKVFDKRVDFTCSCARCLECGKHGTSKGAMVKKLAEIHNIKMEEIMSFGDGLNDMPMIKMCGMGVAVENAISELKECADYVTKKNVEDGVAYAIEKFALD